MTKALDVDIASVDVTQIGAGVGIASLLYRAKLTYAHEANGPTSVVVKLPATDEGTRMVMNLFDFYSKECRFYAELADATPVNTPTIHHNDVDVDTNDFVLVMEDLVGVRSVDQIEGCTLAEAMAAMSSLARIHATWWEAGPIEDVEWLPRPGDSPYPEALAGQVAASWPNVMADHADLVSSETAALGARMPELIPLLMSRLSEGPTTLVHGDYRLDNLMFAEDGIEPLTVIDWQICLRGRPGYDLGYFMSQSLDSKMRAEHERDLLSHYHSELVANGVEGYDPDEMWDDYRLGILYCFAYPASAAAVELVNDRAVALFRCLLERSVAAIEETGALEIL
jgi:aminoglycoside/choline kinase family phosphotransferase